ncbi:hypothetical protein [Burkholderia phage vB_BpP_HN03]|uniref:Uncharacterized protein n=1 Tax=Burkholderia phage vB_BpP_HN02 TaxID=3116925 RepID=A0AAX4JGX2_9CAUD|nr:hypothetical protein [Burkholderia phage vB_BpP_HN01]
MRPDYVILFIDDLEPADVKQAIDECQQGALLGAFDIAETQADVHNANEHARLTQRTKKPLPYYHGNKRRF